MDAERTSVARPGWAWTALVATLLAASGCANQHDVIPMLHVEPSAASRMAYFEKRNAALIAESPDAPPSAAAAEAAEGDADQTSEGEAAADGANAPGCAPAPLRTWGGGSDPALQGNACDSGGND